ncbi:MAG TPA: alpha-L-arabinofuranosidase C-terminal domain-containing protein [Balneolales bacterium]|nr:alpha-L-arabinofuranosidase C-terminal domain-containing protein [Balneolales bacterium]
MSKLQKISGLLIVLTIFIGFRSAHAQQKNQIIVNADQGSIKISKYIYGQFAEDLGNGIYGGIWVGKNSNIPNIDGMRKDVIDALRKLDVPDVRWPGGCFADRYNWRDGIGPEKDRPKRVDMWGNVTDTNAFGTNEFLKFCKLIGAQPYLAGNVGSGTVRELKDWVTYMTYPGDSKLANMRRKDGHPKPYHIKFFGVGNESWGCGGQMTPEHYANVYRRYAEFIPNYGGNHLFKIASGPNGGDYHWTKVLMKDVGHRMNGMSLHYYTIAGPSWGHKGSSTHFGQKLYFDALKKAMKMNTIVKKTSTIMNEYDPQKKIALVVDEWGIWTDPLPGSHPGFLRQQNTLRDALIASTTLDIFNKHAARVKMANIAQMINVLQSMIMTKGKKMFLTPTYYVFDMYKKHMGATYLPLHMNVKNYTYDGQSIPSITATASKDSEGNVHLTISNLNPNKSQQVTLDIRGLNLSHVSNGKILTAKTFDSYNTFDHPNNVKPEAFHHARLVGNKLIIDMPSKSLVSLDLH